MPDPTVREMLPAKVDDLTGRTADLRAEVREVTEQLAPERARSYRNAITMASEMVDEIRLRAHARPSTRPRDVLPSAPSRASREPAAGGNYSKHASAEPRWDRENSLISAPGVMPRSSASPKASRTSAARAPG